MAIRCASCKYDNDPTRVYCHNCGVKLERDSSAPPPPTGYTHPTDVAKMQRRSFAVPGAKYFVFLLKLCLLAALAAAVTAALLPPRDIPPRVAPDENFSGGISELLYDLAAASSPGGFARPAGDVHRWLVSSARFAAADSSPRLKPVRIYYRQGESVFCVGLQTSVFDLLDVYFEAEYAPVRHGARYALEPVRFSIGRLPLPVALGWPVERQLAGLRDALALPLDALGRASYIGITPEEVTLRWGSEGNQ